MSRRSSLIFIFVTLPEKINKNKGIRMGKKSADALITSVEELFKGGEVPSEELICEHLYTKTKENPFGAIPVLQEVASLISKKRGLQSAYNIFLRMEVALGLRKPEIGIYDNAFHFIGGAQKYGCTIASTLQQDFDVTLIANADISLKQLKEWYDLDLSKCKLKVVQIPFFETRKEKNNIFDAGLVDLRENNPFHIISKESGNYDIFVNNCMLEMVYPLANISEFICHFPEREISRFFHVDKYSHIIFNSLYTAEWIKKRWKLKPHKHIYPPIDMETSSPKGKKENIILSVSRFELSGNKKQKEMVKAFMLLSNKYPDEMKKWKMVLAGGSTEKNVYLHRIRNLLTGIPESKIELKVNISSDELKKLYRKAKIFWHFCGIGQVDPACVEHFGMTTVEAMQNYCVPIIFNGGGQKEAVKDGESGFLFKDFKDLYNKTIRLIRKPEKMQSLSEGAYLQGKKFTKKVFSHKIKKHFEQLIKDYSFSD